MHWSVDPTLSTPAWRQLVNSLLDGLAQGEPAVGERLPSVRGMAAASGINHNTVARAYRELEQAGLVRGERGRGVFVRPDAQAAAVVLRKKETLAQLRLALGQAHRAGHSIADLRQALASIGRESA